MATWNLDNAHSEIEFKVKHMMISTVKGQFQDFQVTVDSADTTLSDQTRILAEIKVESIDTKNKDRDAHLKNEDFFNTTVFPNITFQATAIENKGDGEYQITGDLTIKDVTRSVAFDVEFGGLAKDPWGNQKAGYTVTGKINRNDFGLTYNAVLETGGVMLSDEVKFQADLQFVIA
ncbi:YceI family protein [Sphingobacterium wenxiniae]|uniref:Polyisoprenoid-binding protein YceI n=1 Tax=Sphingobacterium wenxiniae TaxID=683125 RepID=A0A1I6NSA8_9SPHI|nr:YceI family protein [Sphingobacterium wenxiniae]SFS30719.1 Polyisoprenoid-binding protein YceI [Sphingobacterium wenxiniae]